MPLYSYELEGRIVEVYQGMNDKHEYFENGKKFNRVWEKPQASSSTQIDPFNKTQFIRSLDGKHGETLGNTFDRSAELSEKRAERLGKDPIKQKYFDKFKKTHKGFSHPAQTREECAPQVAKLKELGIKVNL